MRIGITYDLREEYIADGYGEEETAEFDRRETIDAIDHSLRELGYTTDRIGNVKTLTKRLVSGERWDMVFNIAEGLYGFGRESQVPALLEVYNIPYTFSDPLVLAVSLHKGITKHIIRDLGIPTPDFAVIENMEDADNLQLPFPLFVKPVAEGTGKGINSSSKVTDREKLLSACKKIMDTYRQPVLVEKFLSGREFTVGIIGTGKNAVVIGAMEVILNDRAEADAYSYYNKKEYRKAVGYQMVNDTEAQRAKEIALQVWAGLGCRDAGRIDIRSDGQNNPNFLEVNPLAGINPEDSDLCLIADRVGITYLSLIKAIVISARDRYKL